MKYLNALNKIQGVGPQKMRMLLDFFGKEEAAWDANVMELTKVVGESLAERINNERKEIDPEEEWERLLRENIRVISFDSEEYPELLKEIPSPPFLLYVRGKCDFNSQPMISIVGSRKFSRYGDQVAHGFAQELSRMGITVVSGMAIGIDAIAHRGSLDAGGKTIAVLGSDLSDKNIGPKNNFNLSRRIIENGTLVSDYPLDTPASVGTFPARNRIMAGITLGTLVIEAAEGSGSLITASLALDFNREVFAVPGSILSPVSTGTNNLIKSGAKMATNVKDILEELNIEKRNREEKVKKEVPSSKEEELILKNLTYEPIHVDKIIKITRMKTNVTSSTLSIMEMKGLIKDTGGQNYIKI